jgi:hypothetical protein
MRWARLVQHGESIKVSFCVRYCLVCIMMQICRLGRFLKDKNALFRDSDFAGLVNYEDFFRN